MKIKNIINPKNNLLNERKSIRKYDTSVKISRDEISNILQDALTAPSSFNLQPWRLVVVDTPEGKEKIKPYMSFNQLQWETSAAIIGIYGDLENTSKIDDVLSANVEHKLMPKEATKQLKSVIVSYEAKLSSQDKKDKVIFDCGLVTMQIMLSAKAYGYDTNPIGGFQKEEFSKVLDIDTKQYMPLLLLSIGKAAEKGKDSVRFSVDEITTWK